MVLAIDGKNQVGGAVILYFRRPLVNFYFSLRKV